MSKTMENNDCFFGTLAEYLEYAKPSLKEILSRMDDIGALLQRIHSSGCMCLVLSPYNIYYAGCFAPMYTGIPISKESFQKIGWGQRKLPADPQFSAPEVIRFAGNFTERCRFSQSGEMADLYSFGKILEFCVRGTREPHPAELTELIRVLTQSYTVQRMGDLSEARKTLNAL